MKNKYLIMVFFLFLIDYVNMKLFLLIDYANKKFIHITIMIFYYDFFSKVIMIICYKIRCIFNDFKIKIIILFVSFFDSRILVLFN